MTLFCPFYSSSWRRSSAVSSRGEFQRGCAGWGASQGGCGNLLLPALHLEDLLLHGVPGDHTVGENGAGLPDAVCPVDGLGFRCRIPPGIQQIDIVCRRQIQAYAACLQADKENADFRRLLKLPDDFATVLGLAVQIAVFPACGIQVPGHQLQQRGELGEDQRLVAGLQERGKVGMQDFQLGGGICAAALVDEARMAGGLS